MIVNARLAERRWPQLDPIGHRIAVPGVGERGELFTVVGVTGNARQGEWAADEMEEMFFLADPEVGSGDASDTRVTTLNPQRMTLVLRTANPPSAVIGPVQDEIARLAPGVTISDVITIEAAIGEQVATPRFYAWLMSVFALVALVIAAVGVYGVISYSVSRRAREIGIRIALGAGAAGAFRLVLREGLRLAAVGSAVGLALALALSRFVRALLYGVAPTDPMTFVLATAALAVVAFLASALPARRAARVDPVEALRGE